MEIDKLRQEEQDLLTLLSKNRQRQKELNKVDFVKKYGFDIGDPVEWMDGRTKREGVISRIEFSGVMPSYYHVNLYNSDWKVGKREMRIWSYSVSSMKPIKKES